MKRWMDRQKARQMFGSLRRKSSRHSATSTSTLAPRPRRVLGIWQHTTTTSRKGRTGLNFRGLGASSAILRMVPRLGLLWRSWRHTEAALPLSLPGQKPQFGSQSFGPISGVLCFSREGSRSFCRMARRVEPLVVPVSYLPLVTRTHPLLSGLACKALSLARPGCAGGAIEEAPNHPCSDEMREVSSNRGERADLTPEEDAEWVEQFCYAVNVEDLGDKDADRYAWEQMQLIFPRLRNYFGAKP